jgi:fatty-acyl-CoA synthase
MTETTPLGTVSRLKSHMHAWPEDRQFEVRAKQGIPVPGVEIRVVDEDGNEVPWDGKSMGELQVRGPWVISAYYDDPRSAESFIDGWFRTGDVVTMDSEGYIQIVDRTKDLVKSGGEWISTVELENAIMAHAGILEATVIAVPHPKWQLPDDIVFVEAIPKTSVGKFDKKVLRVEYANYRLPETR